jgi:hypothetical protein
MVDDGNRAEREAVRYVQYVRLPGTTRHTALATALIFGTVLFLDDRVCHIIMKQNISSHIRASLHLESSLRNANFARISTEISRYMFRLRNILRLLLSKGTPPSAPQVQQLSPQGSSISILHAERLSITKHQRDLFLEDSLNTYFVHTSQYHLVFHLPLLVL